MKVRSPQLLHFALAIVSPRPDQIRQTLFTPPAGLCSGHDEMVRMLLKAKSSPDPEDDQYGFFPLLLSVTGGHEGALSLSL